MTIRATWRWKTKRTVGVVGRRTGMLPPRAAVLMYHRVADEAVDPWGLTVSPLRFAEQLQWLQQHRTVLSLVEFVLRHGAGTLPPRATAITFDDGYACNATTAVPLLVERGLPATIFLTTGPIDAAAEYWWDDLQRIVFDAQVGRLVVTTSDGRLSVDIGERPAAPAAWNASRGATTAREKGFMTLWRALRDLGASEQTAAIAELRSQAGTPATPRASHRPMTAAEVQSVAVSDGIDIGNHTVTHPALSEWPEEVQRAEITRGSRDCERLSGRAPSTFAYPYGDHSTATVDLVHAAGFVAACTTESAAVTSRSDTMRLPRMQVENWSAAQLAKAMKLL